SHGVLSEGAAGRIGDSPIKQLFITDTIEPQRDPMPDNVTVISVANLFARAIRSIHDRTSVSMLFPDTRPPK
ncbi:MAG: ribose-phosphate pyrophosphokinase, partial [Planctomycetes bacterium]|nr:ribose-phosphate pyrophosphokinase [Planctomycetota bacterium]